VAGRRGGGWRRWVGLERAGPSAGPDPTPTPTPTPDAPNRFRHRYEELSRAEADVAFEAFVAERPAALERLAADLRSFGVDPSGLLDPTPERLTPLWLAVRPHLADRRPAGSGTRPDPALEAPDAGPQPSWVRHTTGVEGILTDASLHLVDGLISHIAHVVQRAVPEAAWRIGFDRVRSYHLQQHPVLGSEVDEVGITEALAATARRHLLHLAGDPTVDAVPDDVLTARARGWIERLSGPTAPLADVEDEPLVEVSAAEGDETGWFDVFVREDVAHERSELVDRLADALAGLPGVEEAFREDRERLLVRAPTWQGDELRLRAVAYLDDGRRDERRPEG
jgi:hypothetical protein